MNKNRLEKLAEKFRINEYETVVCQTKQEAKNMLLEICKGKNVGVGDSHSVEDLCSFDDLAKQANELYAMGLDKSIPNRKNA